MAELSGVFAINKPSGITSSNFLAKIQQLFTQSPNFTPYLSHLQGLKVTELQKSGQVASRRKLRSVLKVKLGHGGTLDPLASGVLVIGVNKGTKKLQNYLNGSVKTYETEALLGMSTTTGDCEGEILSRAGVNHVTKADIAGISEKFIGELRQTPPIYAALKMNGKPLYEYARENLPLPREIKSRVVNVYEMEMFEDSLSKDHDYEALKIDDDEKVKVVLNHTTLDENALYYSKEYMKSQNRDGDEKVEVDIKPWDVETQETDSNNNKLPMLHFRAKVSSGTYIRSLISDVGKSLGSAAYMVKLIRSQQAEWELGKNVFEIGDFTDRKDEVWGSVLRKVFEKEGDVILSELFEAAELEAKAKAEAVASEVADTSEVPAASEATGDATNDKTQTNSTQEVEVPEDQEQTEPDSKKRRTE